VNDAVQYLAVLRKGGGVPDQEGARPQRGDLRMRQRISRAHYASLADLFNPSTFRHIDALGIQPGWRCWEVGAGGPTVPAWLARRVAPGGHVLATDIDVAALQEAIDVAALPEATGVAALPEATGVAALPEAAEPGFEVLRHDVAAERAPAAGFDLVHARLVVMHLAARGAALAAMTGALRPGGWLLLEDADLSLQSLACPDETGPAEQLANKIRRASVGLRGDNLAFGRTLPRLLRGAGLTEVGADAYLPIAGPASARLEQTMIERQRDRLLAAGLLTAAEIDRHLADVAAGRLDLTTFTVVSAWGRKES
jgi:2-polyprenyl-3-methyl-5-hydroxy-6-metoxy-1,4-benzoquinol methylase